MTAIDNDNKAKPSGSVKLDMTGALRTSLHSDEGFVDEVTADESFSEVSIDEEGLLMKNPDQSALFDYLTARFQTNCPFSKRSDTPGTHHVSDAIAAFRYTQRFYIELNELSGAYFTEYIRPHKRGAIIKMTCHGSFTQSFVYLVVPSNEDGPVIAYRSCFFRVADDEAKTVDEEETIDRITRFDTILSVQLPRGLSSECALDARYLIYFLQHYGNEPLEGLPEVGDIPAYMKVFLPVNKDFKRGAKKSKKKSKRRYSSKLQQEEEEPAVDQEDYVLVFDDKPCTAFLEQNRYLWENSLAKVSPKYHEHDAAIEKRTMSIVNLDPKMTAIGKKKFDGPDHTTLRLEPALEDIGEGWKFFACMLLLLSHTISVNHGENYLARCVRACYGLRKFDEVVSKASAAQPYLLRKLAALRGACFMARSERIYIDHTDLKFKDMDRTRPPNDEESGRDIEEAPSHRNPTDDLQMTIVPITHKLGSLCGDDKTLKLETQYGFALGKLFLICLSHETYGGYSRAENTFGTYISQTKKIITPDPTPSSRFRLLDKTEIQRIKNDWMQLMTVDRRLPGVAIHVSENGTKNITVPEYEENGHIQWVQEYNFAHALVVLIGLVAATCGAWILETGAFHLILALLFVDLVKAEVGLFGALQLLVKGKGQPGPHCGMLETYTRIICILALGLVQVLASNLPKWSVAFQPYVIASGALVGTMLLLPILARSRFTNSKEGGLSFDEIMARDGSLECILSPQKGGAYRGCDREGAHGLGLLQAQNFEEVFDHDGSLATTLVSPGPRLKYWVSSGLKA